jgi:hypothetical protein
MRLADFAFAAAVVAGLSGTAMAQTPASSQTPATQPAPVAVAVPQTPSTTYANNWVASAFVGTNFGSGSRDTLLDVFGTDNRASINFGGQVAYLWGGYFGAEGLVDFAPSFSMDDLLFDGNPSVNTYMLNLIGAVPVGSEKQFFPYLSGGFGGVSLHSTIFTLTTAAVPSPAPITTIGTVNADRTQFGGNIGGGVYGFSGSWGFRGDIRYYRSSSNNNIDLINNTEESIFAQEVLDGLSFWKANVGVAFRW